MAIATIPQRAMSEQGFAFRNLIINGDMSIDQRNSGSSITPTNGQYGVDRWQNAVNVSSKYSIQQVSDAPTGFIYSNKVTSLSAYSIGAGELAGLRQYIEGYNITKLDWGTADAQTVTLSFWVKSSLTGDFGVTIGNDNGRTYGALYNISSADTWEKKSVTVEGDTTGTWLTTNGKGISLVFGLSTGSAFLATADLWNASTSYGVTGQTQILATNAATWQVTGVQLEVGTSASDFEFLPYDVNLLRCQRYLFIWNNDKQDQSPTLMGYGNGTSDMYNIQMPLPVNMRNTPSVSLDPGSGSARVYVNTSNGTGADKNPFSFTTFGTQGNTAKDGTCCLSFIINGFGGSLHSSGINSMYLRSTRMICDAEL